MSAPNVISIYYTLTDKNGEILDRSPENEPLAYLEDAGMILPALEEALRGLAVGTKKQIHISASRAYGERNEDLVQKVAKTRLPADDGELKIGDMFHADAHDGTYLVKVIGFDGDMVVLDGNHPLAGVDLIFDIEIAGVRPATEKEIAHGHPHCHERECCGDHHHSHGKCCGHHHHHGDGECGCGHHHHH